MDKLGFFNYSNSEEICDLKDLNFVDKTKTTQ